MAKQQLQPESVKCTLSDGKQSLVWRFNPATFTYGVTRNSTVQYPLAGDAAFVHQTGLVQTLSIPLEYPDFSRDMEIALKVVNTWVRDGSMLKLSYGQHQYPFVVMRGFSATITRYESGAARSGGINIDLVVVGEKGTTPVFNKEESKKPVVKTPRELAKSILNKPKP